MWIYRNNRTGQVVELAARSGRLDALPNWALIGAPAPDDDAPAGQVTATAADPGHAIVVRPPDNAPKPAWVAYAVAKGAVETDARALSKAALIEEWGGEDGED